VTGTLTVDAADVATTLELDSAERWHVLVLQRGTPVARVELPSPGATATPALAAAAVLRWADAEVARAELVERLRERIGQTPPKSAPARLRCSVIVCTHRRPQDLAALLDGLTRLDPAPDEIVVVDNDPGEHACRAEVLAVGARYVREDRRGLNNARNAGVRASDGDVVAFIDDDCVPSPGWLARLPLEFAHPAVGVVTGPAFPLLLDTPARQRMERQASLARGLRRLELDWTLFPVAGAGALGVGANMAFRRAALACLGPQPFPPELDAGTATESGGDTYVIAKMLAAGQRVVYDPATFIYHRHRADGPALHRAVFGYGVGLGAALTRLLVKDRELSTPATWMWLLSQYRTTQQRRLAGRADSVETRLAWDYVRGGLLGPLRWRRALAEAARAGLAGSMVGPAPGTAVGAVGPRPEPALGAVPSSSEQPVALAGGAPKTIGRTAVGDRSHGMDDALALSVIVPTSGRPRALDRCLGALAEQDVGGARFEVVVVDDSAGADARIAPCWVQRLQLRRVDTHASGAAAARNAGAAAAAAPLLLFIDDDVVADPDLVQRHLERHAAADVDVVVGAYPPRPLRRSLAATAAALWWEDLVQALRRAVAPTFVGALTGNMSISRAAFERSGGFDARFGRYRREDWEWGVRALGAGLRLCFEPAARGRHEYALDAAGRLRAAELEGHGDALMLDRHPHAAAAILPLVADPTLSGGRRGALERAAWGLPGVRAATHTALGALEWARLRLLWVRVFNAAQRLSYEHGARAAGIPLGGIEEPLIDVDLDAAEPIAAPVLAPQTLRVRVGGREVARVRPALGQWTPELAQQIVDTTPWQAVEQAAAAGGCWPQRDERHDHAARTEVIFGPGHSSEDAVHAPELTAAGATVRVARESPKRRPRVAAEDAVRGADRQPAAALTVAEGPCAEHWSAVLATARAGERELVALTLPGTRPDPRWLEQALVAFEGSRVGAVLGRALPEATPPTPLVLHALGDDDPELLAAAAPQYVVLRRELLPALAIELAGVDPVAPLLALVQDALQGGWVVGFRDVHGLAGAAPRDFDAARAASVLRLRGSRTPVATAAVELRRATLIAAWRVARGRGRRTAAEAYAGTLAGLASPRAWRSATPRRFARR
jgi:glycosyltransferase involved in cell wall biosynthesis